jgi:hypothetical protein
MESIGTGHAAAYFPLAEQFVTQSSPPLCGPATIAMLLNSLAVDPGRVWKGTWRWYSEEMLLACSPLDWSTGITMDEFAHLAECNGAIAKPFVIGGLDASLSDFRACVRRVCSSQEAQSSRLAVNFSRATLNQTGVAGHYSPIAAYNEKEDSVLVMDVARFKYPPFWVSVPLLWEAMRAVDPATGKSRGFIEIVKSSTTQTTDSKCRESMCSPQNGSGVTTSQLLMQGWLQFSSQNNSNGGTAILDIDSDKDMMASLVKVFLENSESFIDASRPLSHFIRMQLVQQPRQTELALRSLRESMVPILHASSCSHSQAKALWPSHPQLAVELTALVILASSNRLQKIEPFRRMLDHALPPASRVDSDAEASSCLRYLVDASTHLLSGDQGSSQVTACSIDDVL